MRFDWCHRTVFWLSIVKRLIGLRPVIFTNPQNISINGHKLKLPSSSLPAGGKSSLSGATGITVARECAAVELPTLAEHPIINNEYDRRYFSWNRWGSRSLQISKLSTFYNLNSPEAIKNQTDCRVAGSEIVDEAHVARRLQDLRLYWYHE